MGSALLIGLYNCLGVMENPTYSLLQNVNVRLQAEFLLKHKNASVHARRKESDGGGRMGLLK